MFRSFQRIALRAARAAPLATAAAALYAGSSVALSEPIEHVSEIDPLVTSSSAIAKRAGFLPLSAPAARSAPPAPDVADGGSWEPLPVPGKPREGEAPRPGGKYASLPDMIEAVFPSVVKVQGSIGDRRLGGGSGFVISADGLCVSNDHVFRALQQAGVREVQALFDDGRTYAVDVLASDPEADIAVARIRAPRGTRFQPLRFGSSSALRRGDTVAVLGAPLGGSLVPAVGVLGGIRYVADDEMMAMVLNSRADWSLLQVDASMSSGSSGGPVVNADGEVVGVSVLVQTAAGMGGVGNLNFAVASDQAHPIIESLLKTGTVTRAAIGMTIVLVDQLQAAKELAATGVALLPPGDEHPTGLLVTYALPGKPAAASSLREGDVILEIDGRKMATKGAYFAALGPVYQPGKTLECKVWRPAPGRKGRVFTCTIAPEVRQESQVERRRRRWTARRDE